MRDFAGLMGRETPHPSLLGNEETFKTELEDATAQHLGLDEDGRPQPQPGQERLPTNQIVDVFGTRPQPGAERFAVPPNQPEQQSLVQVVPNQNQPQE